ncbi:hypothetical protein [Streptomyces sp. CB02400]|uniref:hypothetical protein n=1 Tax=Streptomyces sp. CB02400 TaxID=1703944 RepID=UPI00093DC79C|nr:hypothetical protein [Streptomyces sp. CB02400]OKK09536.1 hypothetical protein AMK33_16820 [Streptomyces sp. CB02400]
MSVVRVWKGVRRADRSVAPFVVAGNVLVGGVLLWLAIGGIGDPATREEENAAQDLALRIFGCWLLGGVALFAVLGMVRSLLGHLAALLLTPLVITVALMALA